MRDLVLHEVGVRDGLQMEEQIVPTEQKLAWIEALLRTGVDIVQLGSFVHPVKVPQMADTDRLFEHFTAPGRKPEGTHPLRTRPEREGSRARPRLRCRDVLHGRLGLRDPLPEEHRHEHRGRHPAHRRHGEERAPGPEDGPGLGPVRLRVRLRGADPRTPGSWPSSTPSSTRGSANISLADTAGQATPEQVESLFGRVLALDDGHRLRLPLPQHLRPRPRQLLRRPSRRRRGPSSRSVAGLGGCPFTAVAGGNTCTEDLVHALQRVGERRDVDLERPHRRGPGRRPRSSTATCPGRSTGPGRSPSPPTFRGGESHGRCSPESGSST